VRQAGVVALALLLCLGLSGCIPGYVRLSLSTTADTNSRQPVYMLIRTLEHKAYLGEAYADVAAKLSEPDASVLLKELIIPGRSRTLYIKQPKGAVAIYFMFTAPGGSWRMIIDPPLPWQVKAELRGSSLIQQSTAF
jgi:hypothetical protein